MKNRLIEIINVLKQVKKDLNLDLSDSTIFQEACTFARGERIEENKRENYSNNKKVQNNPTTSQNKAIQEEPTDKQIIKLKAIGKYKEGMTKKQAWEIINKNKQEDY